MNKPKGNVLVITEGTTEKVIMEKLFTTFGFSEKFVYHSYGTNLYPLFNALSKEQDRDNWDILLLLRSKESNPEKQRILNLHFAEIIMVFDFDPHDPQYSDEKIIVMTEYFNDSSEMGKLYINYPMAEAFYHMKNVPDNDFYNYVVRTEDLKAYKSFVQKDFQADHRKFATNKNELGTITRQNIDKAWYILNRIPEPLPPSQNEILSKQARCREIAVLCTCVFYVTDFNRTLAPNLELDQCEIISPKGSANLVINAKESQK